MSNSPFTRYRDGLKEHIPAGLYGSYVTIDGMTSGIPQEGARLGVLWAAFGVIVICVVLWIALVDAREANDSAGRKWMKICFGAVSFIVLVMCIGGPFTASVTYAGGSPETVTTIRTIGGILGAILTLAVFPIILGIVSRRS
jgi:hypothetical protein